MRFFSFLFILLFVFSCKNLTEKPNQTSAEEGVTDTIYKTDSEVIDSTVVSSDYTEFKVLDSKFIDVEELWKPFNEDLENFTEARYNVLRPFVLEQDIPTLQKHIAEGKLSYELLTKFYLYRIRQYDRVNPKSLNSVMALNPNIISEARKADSTNFVAAPNPIFGMPILLKDNINASGMPTTAGAVALKDNNTEDAFIVQQLKKHGALILGKANLSEWAYFFCGDCPSGYSAIGGQTLNPYGRRTLDTGGSSSGSGVAVAVNFCAAAVGSETSGSILSPSSQNSIVGLKPTIGLLSRSGIVPISSTLDTPGPMTKNVIDNAIMLDVMFGQDKTDSKSIWAIWETGFYTKEIKENGLKGRRFGVFKELLRDSLYANAIAIIKNQGAEVLEIEQPKIDLPEFLRLLNLDMKKDLPAYMQDYANKDINLRTVNDVIAFNRSDSINKMPYGQNLFEGIIADISTEEELLEIKRVLKENGKAFFDVSIKEHSLDGIMSINNYHAGYTAVAEYPAITVPMGYTNSGEPKGLTFIGVRLQEKFLLQWAYAFEQASKHRKSPEKYN